MLIVPPRLSIASSMYGQWQSAIRSWYLGTTFLCLCLCSSCFRSFLCVIVVVAGVDCGFLVSFLWQLLPLQCHRWRTESIVIAFIRSETDPLGRVETRGRVKLWVRGVLYPPLFHTHPSPFLELRCKCRRPVQPFVSPPLIG